MKVYEALARAFAAEGTTDVFGMMGDANMHWMNALATRGVRLYEVRHEGAGLSMAHGFARAAGRPGVVTTTSGPGTAQLATSMLVASRARVPLVAFCGETALGDTSAVQYLDQRRFAAAIEAEFVQVTKAESAEEVVQRAFYRARTESRPVLLSAPFDVQLQEFEDVDDYVPSTSLLRTPKLLPHPERVEQACEILASAKRPVIVAGRGARRAGAGEQILALQRRTGAVLATTLQAKNWLYGETEYHVGIAGLFGSKVAMEILQEADCVVAVGASLNHYTIESGYLFPEARYVQIDTAPHLVMGNGRVADCYLQADAVTGLTALTGALESRGVELEGFHTPDVHRRLTAPLVDPADYRSGNGLLDPREAIAVIDAELPGEIGLVLGSGHQTDFGTQLFQRSREITSNYGMFGAIGQAPLLTIGTAVATGRPTFVVEGDASFLMHLPEFETACRYDLPVLVVVLNDEGLGAEYHKSVAKGLDPELAVIPTPELGTVARALGGGGATVRTTDELRAALAEYVRAPRPTVIDVRITRDVLSVPYRRIQYGEDV
ncbi:thiamine pyrophosphate-dependent acetolactate synthase large subunit-like protein [Amycolatopsis bartoniae]|uniref:Acetolactate synthase n=1 Tax=Amycolatopsis bartoniae TaxID=941986 RepID=A0A8H9J393_9PSEU|nr:thiamine pyrophosphate-binding protein [Amycolatopsis bartoniae]MBB2938398.1 thiamine pyrophosphate-dependent acetolactate synthase large subunit-like protein [Amycolatopsis bartoniae]TVT06108.1 thiamine pyrophosphate-binding protein [Amycolatopsis bartoniae]GHF71310.1 acetolactate synthase [Amycolatopsis bartoniae]